MTWARVTGANGYDIYRNSKKVKTITSGTTVTWTDTAANTNNTKYVYKVVAKASTGASTLSKSLTTYKVTAPTNRSAVNTATRKAVLTWTRNANASGYQVQYSLTSSFSGAKTVTITKNATLTTTVSSLTKRKDILYPDPGIQNGRKHQVLFELERVEERENQKIMELFS